ncbi:MAG: hypothetical protein JNM68_10850 [Dinghuibacter sp.]|nr:hypothetical protein [Dinghuibacter sp.]
MSFEELITLVQLNDRNEQTGSAGYVAYGDKYFEISPLMGRLIGLAKTNGSDNGYLAETLSRNSNLSITETQVQEIKDHFVKRVTGNTPRPTDAIRFRVNFIKPALLQKITRPLMFLYQPGIMLLLVVVSVSLIVAALLHYEGRNIFMRIATQFNPQTLVLATAIHTFITLFHELGHATAAARQGLPPGPIGFGVYFFTPVFYANTTHAWQIPSRKRLLINCGGIYFQLILLIPVSLVYLQQGSQLALYLLVLNILTIIANLNPLLKYDGYWIFADLVNLNNLRSKTGSVTRYYILKYLFFRNPEEPADIRNIQPGIKRFLLGYTVLANLLFLYFFCFFIPKIMVTLVQNEAAVLSRLARAQADGLWSFITVYGKDLVNVGLNLLIFLFLARTTLRFFYSIFQFLKNNLFTRKTVIA